MTTQQLDKWTLTTADVQHIIEQETPHPKEPVLQKVERTATCKGCGCTSVAWLLSVKKKKWYLVNAEHREDGWYAYRNGFHKCADIPF